MTELTTSEVSPSVAFNLGSATGKNSWRPPARIIAAEHVVTALAEHGDPVNEVLRVAEDGTMSFENASRVG